MNFNLQITYENYIECLKMSHIEEDDMNHCGRTWRELYGANKIVEVPVYAWDCLKNSEVVTVMTLGDFFDLKMEQLEKREELLMAYIVDAFAMWVLKLAYEKYRDVYYETKHVYLAEMIFFDEEEMKVVPQLLKELEIDSVRCNEVYVMIPQKTVVFRCKTSEKRTAVCENICMQCNNIGCEHRKNAYSAPNTMESEGNLVGNVAENSAQVLNYGYRRIFGNRGNEIWKKD